MKISLILLFALVIRVIFLNVYPNGITNDELHFVLNSKTVFLNFSNLSDNWHPLSLRTIPSESSSELTFLVLAPFIGPLPLNLFTARLPFVLFNIGSIYLLYLISKRLLSQKYAYYVAIIASINPWMYFVSRTSFDAPIAIFFFLLTLYSLLILKNNFIYLSILPSLFAFYCYIGTKVIYVPAIIIFCLFSFLLNRHSHKQYFLVALSSILIFSYYLFSLKSTSGISRTQELWTPFSNKITLEVETERQLSAKNFLTPLFINKYTVYSRLFLTKYLNNFSPDVMLSKGDPTYLVSLWRHGYFYLLDIICFIIGGYFLFTKYRQTFFFVLALILISPIPEAIRSDSIPAYAFHSAFQYPFIIFVIGVGFGYLISNLNKIFHLVIFSLQTLLLLNFLFLYFFAYPIYQPEGFFFSNQVISKYIYFEASLSQKNIVFLTREPANMFRNYLFLTNALNYQNLSTIIKSSKSQDSIKYNNILFTSIYDKVDFKNTILIIERQLTDRHYLETNSYSINKISDNIPMFGIYNSNICPMDSLAKFPRINNYSLFNLTQMDLKTFCQNNIFNFNQI